MNDFERKWHVEAKQKRGADAIRTISEAATLLAKDGRPELLTTRNLSEISGYSTGTIYRYFRRFEDIFVNVFLQRRTQAIDKIVLLIEDHPPAQEARFLVASIIERSILELARPHPKVLQWVLRQFFKHAREPEKLNVVMDRLILPLMVAVERDQTASFRPLSEVELRLVLRGIQAMIRSPFFEQDPIQGTPEHIQFVTQEAVRLLTNLST